MDTGYKKMQNVIVDQLLRIDEEVIYLKEMKEDLCAYYDMRDQAVPQILSSEEFHEYFSEFYIPVCKREEVTTEMSMTVRVNDSKEFNLEIIDNNISTLKNKSQQLENIKCLIDSRIEQDSKN